MKKLLFITLMVGLYSTVASAEMAAAIVEGIGLPTPQSLANAVAKAKQAQAARAVADSVKFIL